jgi:peptidoglycan/LPS O-acetylase OafA/YrhL
MEPTAGRPDRPHQRFPALDGIRGLAILLVMLHHFFQLYEPERVFIDVVFFGLASSGWFGVDLFFVLSGFLITGILYDSKGSERYFLNFYARRTLRIFPLYYAALVLFFVVFPQIPHPLANAYVADSAPDQLWFWTYLTNFKIAANGAWYDALVPNVFWSLAIEEQFYLIWPLVVLLCHRKTLIGVCIGLITMAIAVRLAFTLNGAEPLTTFVITPARMDCLAVGALLALVVRGDLGAARRTLLAKRSCLLLGAVLLALAVPGRGLHWETPLNHTLGLTLVALFFGALLIWTYGSDKEAWIRVVFESRVMRMAGKYSYSMYIFHGPAGTFIKTFYDPPTAPLIFGSALPRTLLYAILAGLVTLGIAWITWNVLEKRMLSFQSRFR